MKNKIFGLLAGLFISGTVTAGDVEIVKVEMRAGGQGQWQAHVTLLHSDSGWEHYADAWRVMTEEGELLGTRVLYHPHVNEQPFTRSLSLPIPTNISVVHVEAHDKVHGWSKQHVRVDLTTSSGDRYTIRK